MIQLADLSAWRIETLDSTDIAGIAPGDVVTVTFDAVPTLALTSPAGSSSPVGETSHAAVASLLPQRSPPNAEQINSDIVYREVIEIEHA